MTTRRLALLPWLACLALVAVGCDGSELARLVEDGKVTFLLPATDGGPAQRIDLFLGIPGDDSGFDDPGQASDDPIPHEHRSGDDDNRPPGPQPAPAPNPVGPCPDGSFRLRAELDVNDAPSGRAEYRLLPGGCERFRVRVEDFAAGTYDVSIDGLLVG